MLIPGNQILLRDFAEADMPTLTYWMQPDRKWQQLDGPYYPKMSEDEVAAYIALLRERIERADWHVPRVSVAIAHAGTDRLLGRVSWYWVGEETNWPAVGIVIYDEADWGRGFGFEALGLWCDYLLRTSYDFARLDLRTWSGNIGMMRLALKLGFQEEARFRKARIVDGQFYDGMGYGVLREEWEERYPDGFSRYLAERG